MALSELAFSETRDIELHSDQIIDLMTRLFDEDLAVERIGNSRHVASSAATIVQMTMKRLTLEKRLGCKLKI